MNIVIGKCRILITAVKVAADLASDSAPDWASDSTHFNRLKVDFRKDYLLFPVVFKVFFVTNQRYHEQYNVPIHC